MQLTLEIAKLTAEKAARRILGCHLVRTKGNRQMVGKVVETEAYHEDDLASHSFRGVTKRTQVMFGRAGMAYVYLTYGMYYCLNVVTGKEGKGQAVLLRALEPVSGVEEMLKNRGTKDLQNLSNGPGKLCLAFDIDKSFYGHDLAKEPLQLVLEKPLPPQDVGVSARVGISRAVDSPLRFYQKNNVYVSKFISKERIKK